MVCILREWSPEILRKKGHFHPYLMADVAVVSCHPDRKYLQRDHDYRLYLMQLFVTRFQCLTKSEISISIIRNVRLQKNKPRLPG